MAANEMDREQLQLEAGLFSKSGYHEKAPTQPADASSQPRPAPRKSSLSLWKLALIAFGIYGLVYVATAKVWPNRKPCMHRTMGALGHGQDGTTQHQVEESAVIPQVVDESISNDLEDSLVDILEKRQATVSTPNSAGSSQQNTETSKTDSVPSTTSQPATSAPSTSAVPTSSEKPATTSQQPTSSARPTSSEKPSENTSSTQAPTSSRPASSSESRATSSNPQTSQASSTQQSSSRSQSQPSSSAKDSTSAGTSTTSRGSSSLPSSSLTTAPATSSTATSTSKADETSSSASSSPLNTSETSSQTGPSTALRTSDVPTSTTTSDEQQTSTSTSTSTSSRRVSSSPVPQTFTRTLESGGVTVVTSTSWVEIVPASDTPNSDNNPDLQGVAGHMPIGLVVSLVTAFFAGFLLI